MSGAPTLSLNNGGVATYAGLTGAGQMTFACTVPSNGVSAGLAATALNLNGATVTTETGATLIAGGALPAPSTILTYNTTTDAILGVTETGSVPGTLAAGDHAVFLLGAGKPIETVTGTPTLSLNDGGLATYSGLTSAGQMEFTYAIPSGASFSDLAPTSLNLAGAAAYDDQGATVTAPAVLPKPAAELSYAVPPPATKTITTTTNTTTTTTTNTTKLTDTTTATGTSDPVAVVTLADGVPVGLSSGQQLGPAVALGGQAARFSDGAGTAIVDPSGNAETLAHLYRAVLGRAPDVAGLEGWIGRVDTGAVSLSTVASDFVGSSEFANDHGSLTDAQFVNVLAENTTGSAATAADQSYVDALSSGTSRGTVALQFAESAPSVVNMLGTSGDSDYGEIYRIYETTLGRAPDATGLPGFLGQLQAGVSLTNIVEEFINSREYLNDYGTTSNARFVTELYKNGLGRSPDALGLQTWVNDLNSGASRANVVLAISDSLEARSDTSLATHDNWVYIPN